LDSNNIADMLKNVLNEPEAFNSLMSAANSIMNSSNIKKSDTDDRPSIDESTRISGKEEKHSDTILKNISFPHIENKHICLVNALKPYLSSERRESAETMLTVLRLLSIVNNDTSKKG